MYILFIILIIIASILLVLAVLAQNPKSGMAANFGASNQTIGVRQTSDFLEKFTWTMAIAIVVLSLLASIAMSSHARGNAGRTDAVLEQVVNGNNPAELPNMTTEGVDAEPVVAPATEGEGVVDGAVPAAELLEEVTAPTTPTAE